MRVTSWVLVAAGVVVVGVLAWAQLAGQDVVSTNVSSSVIGLFAVALILRVLQRTLRREATVREAIAPGVQGLGEVQDLYLGRKTLGPVRYGTETEPVPELVVDRPDPLDEKVWKV